MASEFNLTAEIRDGKGRGASRRLRQHGKVPAILYGGGRDPVSVTFEQDDLMHQMEQEAFYKPRRSKVKGQRMSRLI